MASTADRRAVALAIAGLAFLAGCDRGRSERPRGSAAPSALSSGARDPNPNPKRFDAALAQAGERWRHIDLPDCSPLLADPRELEHCTGTRQAVDAVRAGLARGAAPEEVALLASNAALSAQRASQALRAAGMRRLLEQRAAASKPSAAPAPSAPPAAAKAPLRAGASAPVRTQENRDLDAITAYARVATLGLRELGTVLELGPLSSRQRAFGELTRLAREEPQWAGLRALVAEAFLVEAEPEQKQQLRRLKEQLGS